MFSVAVNCRYGQRKFSTYWFTEQNVFCCNSVISEKLDEPTVEVVAGINFIFTFFKSGSTCFSTSRLCFITSERKANHWIWDVDYEQILNVAFEMTFLLQSISEPLKLGGFEIVWQKNGFAKESKKCEETLLTQARPDGCATVRSLQGCILNWRSVVVISNQFICPSFVHSPTNPASKVLNMLVTPCHSRLYIQGGKSTSHTLACGLFKVANYCARQWQEAGGETASKEARKRNHLNVTQFCCSRDNSVGLLVLSQPLGMWA